MWCVVFRTRPADLDLTWICARAALLLIAHDATRAVQRCILRDCELAQTARTASKFSQVNDKRVFTVTMGCETEIELMHLQHGGVLPFVLRRLINCCAKW